MNTKIREMRENLVSSMKQEKGFTLIEILVVVGIIGLLFVVFLPRIDFAGEQARETGVQTDFRSFQVANEQLFRETAGVGILDDAGDADEIQVVNGALDAGMEFDENGDSAQEDPWGSNYKIEYGYAVAADDAGVKIEVKSPGADGTEDDPAYTVVTYYYQGNTNSCTTGLGTSDIEANFGDAVDNAEGWACGDDLTPAP